MHNIFAEKIALPIYYYYQQIGIKCLPWEGLARDPSLSNKSIAIVGNSGYLLQNKYGKLIDSHDLVLRMNNFITTGYEESVGKKFDIYICNFFRDINFENIAHTPNIIISSVPNNFFKNENGHLTSFHSKEITNGAKKLAQKKIFSPRTSSYKKYADNLGSKPSTGLMAIILAKEILSPIAKNIFITGFSFFQGKNHYFSNQPADTRTHSPEGEIKFAKKLILESEASNISTDKTLEAILKSIN